MTFSSPLQLSLHQWKAQKSIQLSISTSLLPHASLKANKKHLLISVVMNSTHAKTNTALSCFLHIWKHKQTIYIFQRLVKAFNEWAYSVRNHLKQIHLSKLNSVRIFKETNGWNHETTDCFGLTVKLTKPNIFQPFLKTPKSKTISWFDKTTSCFSLSWKNT